MLSLLLLLLIVYTAHFQVALSQEDTGTNTCLLMAIDASTSVSDETFDAMKAAQASVLRSNPSLLSSITEYGVYINIVFYGESQEWLDTWVFVDSEESAMALAEEVENTPRPGEILGEGRSIGGALLESCRAIRAHIPCNSQRQVVILLAAGVEDAAPSVQDEAENIDMLCPSLAISPVVISEDALSDEATAFFQEEVARDGYDSDR